MGIEPITYRLQGGCSAVELRRHHTAKTRQNPPGAVAPSGTSILSGFPGSVNPGRSQLAFLGLSPSLGPGQIQRD